MTRRWTARHAVPTAAAIIAVAAVVGSLFLFNERETPRRSTVAGAQTTRASSQDGGRLFGAIEAKRAGARAESPAEGPSVGDTLTFFDALLNGPRTAPQPTVGEVLVFFNALLGKPGPMPPQPSVADTLIFFHALLYNGDSTAAPVAPSPVEPPPPAPAPPAPRSAGAVPPPTATPAPPPPPPVAPAPAASSDVWEDASFTQAVWNGVNARRAQYGLSPVVNEPRLHTAAANYAELMAEQTWFSHTGPDGSSFVDRIVAAGFPFTVQVGEILAMGSHGWPAGEVVQAWMDSPPHREQMLFGGYTRAGLECAFSYQNGALMVRCAMEFAAG